MTAYLVIVGLDNADKVASCVGVVVGLLALGAPYLMPAEGEVPMAEPDHVEDTGTANATGGGQAVTGAYITDEGRPVRVTRSGDATAGGPDSIATTGIVRRPRP
ncbi:hypothetical protein [Dactylosporangium maewongense]|uniref:hypothetical protein n=1 Tax=Dactylosporangium maewongense TaxID=634393 RepID=UPI0031D4C793